MSFAVVVPMYNEAAGAERCLRTISAALRQFEERCVLIAVNDGSADATGEILACIEPQLDNVLVIHHPQNFGYGRALTTGARLAAEKAFDYVIFMDSDLTNDPGQLPLFVEKMSEGFDLVKASRYMPGGSVVGVPWWRKSISRAGNGLARILYGISLHDCTNGFRAVRSDLYCSLELDENRFPIIMEELALATARGWTLAEVPVQLTNRVDDQRPSSFSYGPRTLWRYLKYPLQTFARRTLGPRAAGSERQ